MTPYSLKRGILQKAVSGRLVPRDPCEGEAEDLLAQNYELALHLPSEQRKKIGQKTTIKPDWEAPFDIPAHWKWESFGSLVINYDSERRPITKSERTHGMYPYYGATGIIDWVSNYLFDGEFLMIGEDGGNFLTEKENSFISNGKFWANNHVHVVRPLCCDIRYLKYFLDSCNLVAMGCINGIAVPKLNQENLNSIQVPVPPLQEQKRIVAKIESIMPLVNKYERAWNQLNDLDETFPMRLSKSIMQAGIEGRLTKQLESDTSVETTLHEIKTIKDRLIHEKRIKQDPAKVIIAEDCLFDIPATWKWVEFGECGYFVRGNGISRSDITATGLPCVRYGQMYTTYKTRFAKAMSYVSAEVFDRCVKAYKGDLLMALTGENDFDIALAACYEGDEAIAIGGDMTKFTPLLVNPMYLVYVLNSQYGIDCKRRRANGNIIVHTSVAKLLSIKIPLPPLEEQERIVNRIEDLLSLCHTLKGVIG